MEIATPILKISKELSCVRWKFMSHTTKQGGEMILSGDLNKKLKELLFEKNKNDYKLKKGAKLRANV